MNCCVLLLNFALICKSSLIYLHMENFQASRETGALKEAKDKLEKQVEELTWRLQLEKRLRVIYVFDVKYFTFCRI